jgi:hypothetical protein
MNLTTLKGGGEGARDERWIQKDYIMAWSPISSTFFFFPKTGIWPWPLHQNYT